MKVHREQQQDQIDSRNRKSSLKKAPYFRSKMVGSIVWVVQLNKVWVVGQSVKLQRKTSTTKKNFW